MISVEFVENGSDGYVLVVVKFVFAVVVIFIGL
jgi:hypothetical protein